jgi:hypothetical protein
MPSFTSHMQVSRSVLLMIFSEHFLKQVSLIILKIASSATSKVGSTKITDQTGLRGSHTIFFVVHQAQDIRKPLVHDAIVFFLYELLPVEDGIITIKLALSRLNISE